jgi:hypothetical protein
MEILTAIKPSAIYDKNLNFLIGSGASYGLFPTLALELKDPENNNSKFTVETLATYFERKSKSKLKTLLFMYYYEECIFPALTMDPQKAVSGQQDVFNNYRDFLKNLISLLYRREKTQRHCNIFTTNYDGCFEHTADELFQTNSYEFVLNDGCTGFKHRHLNARNFKSFVYQKGIFEQHSVDIPQINLLHLHGSIFWKRQNDKIKLDYFGNDAPQLVPDNLKINLSKFISILKDGTKSISDLDQFESIKIKESDFWDKYNQLPIVNPTKWKFHETVFEEHYYQMLRHLSYELEKPQSALITFGFSFADEHILELVKRSISNPTLRIFICCFDKAEADRMAAEFGRFSNVQLCQIDDSLNFSNFNKRVFNLPE